MKYWFFFGDIPQNDHSLSACVIPQKLGGRKWIPGVYQDVIQLRSGADVFPWIYLGVS